MAASFKVLTYNIGAGVQANDKLGYFNKVAIANCINQNNPDVIFIQGIKDNHELEFIDRRLEKSWKNYHYYLSKSKESVAIMAKASQFKMEMVEIPLHSIEGTIEQKEKIKENLAIAKLLHKKTKQFLFVASWRGPFDVTDEKKKQLASLIVRMIKKESRGSFWIVGGDFNISYESGTIRLAQKSNGEFYNLVEDAGRIAYTSNCEDNYFIFRGKSEGSRLVFKDVVYENSDTENKFLKAFPVSSEIKIMA